MDTQKIEPAAAIEHDYRHLTLDALHHLTESRMHAAVRAAARAELESRTRPAENLTLRYRAHLGRSQYGTPRPSLQVFAATGRAHAREIAAATHEVAAELHRTLLGTSEAWALTIESSAPDAVHLELMLGTPAEVRRAMALLEQVSSRSKRGRTGKVASTASESPIDGEVMASPDAAGAAEAAEPAADGAEPRIDAPLEHEPAGDAPRSRRRRRAEFKQLAGDSADSFEATMLELVGLPPCAEAARDGGDKTAAYFAWLCEQWNIKK